jgi:hypothetical protein
MAAKWLLPSRLADQKFVEYAYPIYQMRVICPVYL